MESNEMLDIMVTMMTDLRMYVSQSREVAKRESADSVGQFKAQAIGRIQALNGVYDQVEKMLNDLKRIKPGMACNHLPYGDTDHCGEMSCPNYVNKHPRKQWNIMRISDEVWVSDFFDSFEAARSRCSFMNNQAGEIKYMVAEQ